ncbi:glycosyltransferase family 2 protein [Cytobacillus sp. FSL K6-0265]|uniref:glycosyltransferase family 2 protein n=1 Tax=Cytobacillus sp. FSL K6-0265 TaxID=2921448 RepID=UPI0030F659D0
MKAIISIIVPIYNMEKYVERCLHSLLTQTFKGIEIIAVNDGSTDRTGDILSKYQEKDKRVKVFYQENKGVSEARNLGLKHAIGEYIGFVDPDDWVHQEMYEVLYEALQREQVDIAMCRYTRAYQHFFKEKYFHHLKEKPYRGEAYKEQIVRRLVGPIKEEVSDPSMLDAMGTVWSKLYRRNLLTEQPILFTDLHHIGSNEDTLFNMKVMSLADSFVYVDRPLYHYWKENEHSQTSEYRSDLFQLWQQLYEEMNHCLKAYSFSRHAQTALNNRICLNMIGLGLNILASKNQLTMREKINEIDIILSAPIVREAFKGLDISYFPFVWKVFFVCARSRSASSVYYMLTMIDRLRKKRWGGRS